MDFFLLWVTPVWLFFYPCVAVVDPCVAVFDPCVAVVDFQVYTSSLRKLYEREVRDFMEAAKQKLGIARLDRKGGIQINNKSSSMGHINLILSRGGEGKAQTILKNNFLAPDYSYTEGNPKV